MSLDWQKVHIALAKGMQQAADERALEPPSLAVCKNASFTELGGIQKRHSFSTLTDIPNGIEQPARLAVLNDELIAFCEDTVYSYSESEDKWNEIGDYMATAVSERVVFSRSGDQRSHDMATLGGVSVYCWIQGTSLYLAALDTSTGSVITGPWEQTGLSGSASHCALLAMQSRIVLVVDDGTTHKQKLILPSNVDSATSNEGLRGSLSTISGPSGLGIYIAKEPSSDQYTIAAAHTASGGYYLLKYTAGASGSPTQDYSVSHASLSLDSAGKSAIAVAPDGRVAVFRGNAAACDLHNDDCTADTTAVAMGTSAATAATIEFDTTASLGEYTAHLFVHTISSDRSTLEHNTFDTTATAGTVEDVHAHLGLGSLAFVYDSNVYVWAKFAEENEVGGNGSLASGFRAALQNTYILLRASDFAPIAKASYLTAPGLPSSTNDRILPRVSVSGSTATFLGGLRNRIALGEQKSTGYEENSPNEISVTFNSNLARRTVQMGNTLYATGGQVTQISGSTIAEVGFLGYPWRFDLDESSGSLTGTFVYRITWRWSNGSGDTERSTTATYGENAVASKQHGIDIAEWLCTLKNEDYGNAYPVVEIWRTTANPTVDSPTYLITDPSGTAVSYVTIDGSGERTTVITDNTADSTLIGNKVDPYYGQLEPIAPPSATIVARDADRLFLAGVAGRPGEIHYSRQRADGEVAEFNDALVVQVPESEGAIAALAFLNETLVAFCETGIYMLPGQGFNNDGSGQNYGPPRLISGDVGAVSAEAVAALPDGIIFKSEKGWHLLDRAWQVQYIGAPVEDYDSDTVNGITVMPDKHEVRIATSGRMLVWNTRANAWSEWEFTGGVNSTVIWKGRHVIATNSGSSILVDDQDYSNVDYALDIETAWIKLDGLQGFSRARFLRVLGEYRSAHSLRVRVARNYRKSGGDWAWDDDKYWTATATEAGDALRVRHRLSKQKCEAIKVRLTDVDEDPGAAFSTAPSVLESGSSTAGAPSSFVTGSFTPTADAVLYCAVGSVGTTPPAPTLSGHATWVQVATQVFGTDWRVTLFRAKASSSPSASTVTIDFAGDSQSHCVWTFLESVDADASGSSGANSIGNTATDSTDSATGTLTTSIATLSSTAPSAHLAVVYHGNAPTNPTSSGFSEVSNEVVTSPNAELTILWASQTEATSITLNNDLYGGAVISAEILKDNTTPTGESLKLTGLSLEYGVKRGLGQLPATNKQ